ncbi:uncharacterized protein EV420DRAFT_1583097 [Desarmillaria tabescens]|uniref:Heterokaryon incompatibility domain-containing protein n=1 Tax=Armillaria tabescens TaxID=1929756 RepID=A0AA39MMR3_ARMTA|nr:uncharacterized protein EV420DRAFT_1583097 [Desarmillaria tabescens]KAK0439967.1 hypothetical protein EV420DRAFT_1583097 [Desarmillaria tabescens]
MPIRIVDGGMQEEEWWSGGDRFAQLRFLTRINYEKLPEVTFSAITETGQAESSIPVPMQRSYTGRIPAIRSALADTPCAKLGMNGVLEKLNVTLGTSYTLDNPILPPILESFIRQDHDFGTLYANLRLYWYGLTTVESVHEACNLDQEMRQNVVTNNRISDGNIPPRRVWDLYANRVLPFCVGWPSYQFMSWDISAISHAWMSDKERIDVQTPINGYEWPVPIPKDADLNHIRIEMLNLGAQYVWLDVLCLRQAGGKREDLRREEWKVDVPIIGAIYQNGIQKVVYYLSGLGRPFCLKPGDLESDRCWFRRAWALQEVSEEYIIGWTKNVQRRFDIKLHSLESLRRQNVFDILRQMQIRASTKPLDKVAGLAYLLSTKSIPIYDESQSEEDAWAALTEMMSERYRSELLFLYPEPGDGHRRWRPSWHQVMVMAILPHTRNWWQSETPRTDWIGADSYQGPCVESGYLRGLGEISNKGIPRQGEYIADHAYPIPDGSYTLIGDSIFSYPSEISRHRAVGQKRRDGTFEKVSVIQLADLHGFGDPWSIRDVEVDCKIFLG